jgi:hypothetical protein
VDWCGSGKLDDVLRQIPADWEMPESLRTSVRNFLEQRARFLLACPPTNDPQGTLALA